MKTRTNQPVFKDNGELLKDSDLGDKLPAIEEGDAGKVVAVNEDEDGYELQEIKSGSQLHCYDVYFENDFTGDYSQNYFSFRVVYYTDNPNINDRNDFADELKDKGFVDQLNKKLFFNQVSFHSSTNDLSLLESAYSYSSSFRIVVKLIDKTTMLPIKTFTGNPQFFTITKIY